MASSTDDTTIYVISDLHIGGDEQLEEIEFQDELLAFLARLADRRSPTELIINGDAFGLWEFTEVEGTDKFDLLIDRYPEVFEQLRATGESVDITLLPGNHDHELAAFEEYVDLFSEYNVDLRQEPAITRKLNGTEIYFEHGHQQDPNNRFEDFGNPYERPLGYHYNTHVVSKAGKLSDRGKFNWLKDIQAVTPTERIASWLASKYFYREMNPILRYAAIPFLLLFNISLILAILAGLDLAGIWSMPVETAEATLGQLGQAGATVQILLTINIAIAGLLLLVGIPIGLIIRDVRKTVDRFGIFETDLTVDPSTPYRRAARELFEERPDTRMYVYGHTHRPGVQAVDGGLLVNTGTWLKRLNRREVIAGRLPPVFYPSYEICAVRIEATEEGVTVDYEEIDKPSPAPEELTVAERLLTLGGAPDPSLPDRSVVTPSGVAVNGGENQQK